MTSARSRVIVACQVAVRERDICVRNTSFPHHRYTSMYGCGILPLTYLSSTKQGKKLGHMSAKVVKNCRFFHLLRFLCMETIAKRAKQPVLSSVGEQVLAQY